jgi:hypothetical protein
VPAAPEKVQVISGARDPVQYDYATVLPGGVNRQAFVNGLLAQNPDALLLLAGGLWYDVNQITLAEAKAQNRLDDPFPAYRAVLEDGTPVSHAAAEVIDWVNQLYPLSAEKLQRVYAMYLALPESERDLIGANHAVIDLLAIMG